MSDLVYVRNLGATELAGSDRGLSGGFGQDVGSVCHYLKAPLGLKDLLQAHAHVCSVDLVP